MSKYEPRFTSYYNSSGSVAWVTAMIVRIDRDCNESVIRSYRSRRFKTLAAAQKSTSAHIKKISQ